MMGAARFVGIGWTLLDHIVHVPQFPGENEKMAAEEGVQQVGGPAVRALMLLAGFGAQASLISAVGDDLAGTACVAELREAGVETARVERVPGPTRFAHVWLSAAAGSRTIVYASKGPELNDVEAGDIHGARALISDTRYPAMVEKLAAAARAEGVPVLLDLGSYKSHTLALLGRADVIIAPAATWDRIAHELGHADSLDAMKALDNAVCVRTNGTSEVTAVKSSQVVTYQPPRVRVFDSNGAGDVFLGAFAWEYTRSTNLARALAFASNAAALKCTRGGNRTLPTLVEIAEFERQIKAG